MSETINPVLDKIKKMLQERNWTYYRLAKESGLPYSSLNSMFQKNTQPTLPTLEKICEGLHISMSEFFWDKPPYREKSYLFSDDEISIIEMYRELSPSEQKTLLGYVKGFCRKPLK